MLKYITIQCMFLPSHLFLYLLHFFHPHIFCNTLYVILFHKHMNHHSSNNTDYYCRKNIPIDKCLAIFTKLHLFNVIWSGVEKIEVNRNQWHELAAQYAQEHRKSWSLYILNSNLVSLLILTSIAPALIK